MPCISYILNLSSYLFAQSLILTDHYVHRHIRFVVEILNYRAVCRRTLPRCRMHGSQYTQVYENSDMIYHLCRATITTRPVYIMTRPGGTYF